MKFSKPCVFPVVFFAVSAAFCCFTAATDIVHAATAAPVANVSSVDTSQPAGSADQPNDAFPDLLADESDFEDLLSERPPVEVNDPLEPVNRMFFELNDYVYEWVLKPVNKAYSWAVPVEIRETFGNFFVNVAMPVRLLNHLLQFEFENSWIEVERFLINSSMGIYGLVDVATTEFAIEAPQSADFGQTLGKWGVGEGIFIYWPVVGPSNLRDTVGLVGDAYSHPVPYFHENRTLDAAFYTSQRINSLSLHPTLYDDLKKYSLDPYVAARQAYVEYRRNLISPPNMHQ